MNKQHATAAVSALTKLVEAIIDKRRGPTVTNDILRIDLASKQLISLLTTEDSSNVSSQDQVQSIQD